jgi:hypothetical protein
MYWSNVTIPQGSTINDVEIRTVAQAGAAALDHTIHFNDVDDANDFGAEADVTSRARTSASANTGDASDVTGCFTSRTALPGNIVAALQEVIDRPGWASGNALVSLHIGRTTGTEVWSVQNTGGCTFAQLFIDYTEPVAAGAGGPQQQMMQAAIAGLL